MAFIENTGLERLWGHIVHRLSLKADKTDLNLKADKTDLNLKADKLVDEELLELLIESGITDPVVNSAGALYTDNNGKVYIL